MTSRESLRGLVEVWAERQGRVRTTGLEEMPPPPPDADISAPGFVVGMIPAALNAASPRERACSQICMIDRFGIERYKKKKRKTITCCSSV
jgi:hypothetical protein